MPQQLQRSKSGLQWKPEWVSLVTCRSKVTWRSGPLCSCHPEVLRLYRRANLSTSPAPARGCPYVFPQHFPLSRDLFSSVFRGPGVVQTPLRLAPAAQAGFYSGSVRMCVLPHLASVAVSAGSERASAAFTSALSTVAFPP